MGPGTRDVHVTPAARRDLMIRRADQLVVGGVVPGTWTLKRDDLTVARLDDTSPPRDAIRREVGRLADIHGQVLQPHCV